MQRHKVSSDCRKAGRPISVMISSAFCHEVGLVETGLDSCFVSETPAVLIGDKASDSDPLDASFRCHSIEMVAPHKRFAGVQRHRMVVVYAVSKWYVFSVGYLTFVVW